MRDKEFRITGTMRENRLQKCPLKESKEIKKQNRGALDKISTKEFSVVKWNDNRVATILLKVVINNPDVKYVIKTLVCGVSNAKLICIKIVHICIIQNKDTEDK
jgi:hypothetical protein